MQLFEFIDMLNQSYDILISTQPDSKLHWHYYSEILYIKKGSVSVTCNDTATILEKGDLCYLYPLQLHAVFENGVEVEYAVIKFDLHTINITPAYLSQFYDIFIHRTSEQDEPLILKENELNKQQICSLIEHILSEFQYKKEFYSMQIQSDLHTLLIEMGRKFLNEKEIINNAHADVEFSFYRVLEYIDLHSAEPLEVEKLAEMCHMSYSHFAKLFRENYGRSCKEYITYIRLNKAQDLLLHTDYDLSYIANETGFFDCSHFIRTYKKWKGITPKQQRKKYR